MILEKGLSRFRLLYLEEEFSFLSNYFDLLFLDCTEPAIKEFPPDFMSEEVRNQGGVIVHVLLATYLIFGLGKQIVEKHDNSLCGKTESHFHMKIRELNIHYEIDLLVKELIHGILLKIVRIEFPNSPTLYNKDSECTF